MSERVEIERRVAEASAAIAAADGLLVGAGAGMGVDAGLPDFRGNEGFWRAYPPLRALGLGFTDMATPENFHADPPRAWGFYGHRLELYRRTAPHVGYELLRRWGESKPLGSFVLTSNVDELFQRAGFPAERVLECHGSIFHLQCARPCGEAIWPAEGVRVDVDESTFRAREPLPRCPHCGGLARPNILMFGDGAWIPTRTAQQEARSRQWVGDAGDGSMVVVECGAGTAVPTVRMACERLGATLVRINPREPSGPAGTISIPLGARDALERIAACLAAG